MLPRPHLKICCIASVAEATLALAAGADAIGLVSAMPSGPGVIDDDTIATIVAAVPCSLRTFLLTSRTSAPAIADQVRAAGANTVQVVDTLPQDAYARLRDALPAVHLVQVLHVRGEEALREAEVVAPLVDALLLDSGNPGLAVKELGGTGRVHDWAVSRRIVEASPVPVWLAGGLRAENVRAAIEAVRPFGVDVCSGVRVDGRLDAARLTAFVQAVAA